MAVQLARHLHTPITDIEEMIASEFLAYYGAVGEALEMEAPKLR